MRFLLIGVISGLLATPAAACNDTMFSVIDWRTTVDKGQSGTSTTVEVDVRYDGKQGYRMINAAAMLSDAIGNALVSPRFARDARVQQGDRFTVSATFQDTIRLATIHRDDVSIRTCVWSIVYDDGTKEEFK